VGRLRSGSAAGAVPLARVGSHPEDARHPRGRPSRGQPARWSSTRPLWQGTQYGRPRHAGNERARPVGRASSRWSRIDPEGPPSDSRRKCHPYRCHLAKTWGFPDSLLVPAAVHVNRPPRPLPTWPGGPTMRHDGQGRRRRPVRPGGHGHVLGPRRPRARCGRSTVPSPRLRARPAHRAQRERDGRWTSARPRIGAWTLTEIRLHERGF
jgi:hypothetical protein